MENVQRLMEENIQLKKTLAMFMNKELIKELLMALKRIRSGNFTAEEEFFKNSPLKPF